MSSKAVTKTRQQWAADICAIHKQTVQGIFKMGRTLIAAKKKLPHGEFIAMVEADLPFGKRTAQMLMAIAADARLTKANQGSLLPATWRVLYELHKLSDPELEQAVVSGAINELTKRADVRTMRVKVSYAPLIASRPRISVLPQEVIARPPSRIVFEDRDAAPTHTIIEHLPRVTLHQIERLVANCRPRSSAARSWSMLDSACVPGLPPSSFWPWPTDR